MADTRKHGEAGFTLVELLIALALLGVIAALLVGAVVSARQALNAVGRHDAQAAVPAVEAVLRRLITEARPGPDAREPDPDRAFVGHPDRLSFVSSFVPRGQYAGLWRYDIGLDAGGAGAGPGTLVIAQRLLRPGAAAAAPAAKSRTVLLAGVEALRVRYFGALDQDRPPAWHDSWPHPVRLPRLVLLEITFPGGDPRQWITLVARPALAP